MKRFSKLKSSFGPLLLLIAQCAAVHAEECSLAKTNHSCTLTIDRKNPLAPPTIQMYPGQKLTVLVKNPYYFERYFLDYSSGQLTLAPDILSSIVNGLLTPLQKGSEIRLAPRIPSTEPRPGPDPCSPANLATNAPGDAAHLLLMDSTYRTCFIEFAQAAKKLYLQLEPAAAPDSHSPDVAALPSTNRAINMNLQRLVKPITDVIDREFQLSANIAKIAKNIDTKAPADQQTSTYELSALAALADAVAKDLAGYAARIPDLPEVDHGQMSCADSSMPAEDNFAGNNGCVPLFPLKDPPVSNSKMVTRQITYAVDALNLVQNSQDAVADPTKKRTVASITIFYGDARWEASAGTFFSTLAVRSFSVAPVLTGGVVTDHKVAESVLHPTVVPFAAANFRLSNDLSWTKWRSAFYWTFAAGVNPNTVSADFASGPSLSWRGLMFSALWHYGHDVRLTQGLYNGQSLGASFSGAATTETFWRSAFAIGIAVRVPSLSGR